MNAFFSVVIFLIGLIIIIRELNKPSFGWICYPFAMIAFWIVLDVSVSPYLVKIVDIQWPQSYIIQRSASTEYLPSACILILWYASITFGMVLVGWSLHTPIHRKSVAAYMKHTELGRGIKEQRIFKAGLALTGAGLLCNLIIFSFFQSGVGIEEIARLRLFYSAARDLERPAALVFGYLRMFSYLYQLGVVMLVMNCGKSMVRRVVSLAVVIVGFVILAFYGGRESIVLLGIAVLFALHYGKKENSFRALVLVGVMSFMILIVLTSIRFGIDDLGESAKHLTNALFTNHHLDDVSFVSEKFPRTLEPLYGRTILSWVWGFFSPGISLPWFENFYRILVDNFGTRLYYLYGGVHYSSAAEGYANFGNLGVVCLGIVSGVIFGLIFSRQARAPYDSFFKYYTILCAIHLFSGLPTKMPQALSSVGFFSIVPIALIKSTVLRQQRSIKILLSMMTLFATFFMLYQFTQRVAFKGICAFLLIAITLVSIRFLLKERLWRVRMKPPLPNRDALSRCAAVGAFDSES
jgi:oligosaccharide repeat unit polymerase